MADARAWVAEHGGELVGRPVGEASELVDAAQLTARAAAPGEALTLAFRPDRVTLLTDAEGAVREVQAG